MIRSSPNIAVNYSGGVLATITPVTCMAGSPQYSIDNRLNDGSWSGYTAWSSSTSASQTASEGVKYGYRAKARCYVNSTSYSTGVDGSESTYIHPISTVPSAPSVSSTSNVWPNTVYSWTTPSCPSGTSTRFQYDFTTSYGYDSGWVSTSSTSVSLSTSTAAQTYTLNVHAQCYTAFTSGSWGSSGATSYYRPNLVIAYAIGAGGDGYSPFCDGCGAGGGGGGGAYAQSSNIFLNNGTNLSVTVGTSGTTSNFGNIVVAAGGQNCGSGNSYGVGGQAGSSTGSIRYSGGNGGIRSNSASTGHSAGGGGAAGPNGNGTTAANATGDGAGAGASNGGNANNNTTPGGAGGGCTGCNGGAGGSAWNGGGGGGGAGNNASGGSPGNYGGGGGGGEYGRGVGGNGVVVIYYPNGSMSASGGSISADGSYTYHTFTGSGTFSVY